MQLFRGVDTIQVTSPTVATIGNFDGLHRGHQALLGTLKRVANEMPDIDTKTALITFDPHPLSVLRPDYELELLTTPLERTQLASELGIDIGVIIHFTREVAALSPDAFLSQIKERLHLKALVVGPDFALGRNRSGTLDRIAEIGDEMGFELVVQEHVTIDGESVRSQKIRGLLREGDISEANTLLGRPYHMAGKVVRGDQLGRSIGIPTANIQVEANKLWPNNGVYATRTWVLEPNKPAAYGSVTNIGVRPTVNGRERRLESHLLDFPPNGEAIDSEAGNLYGMRLVVEFIEHLRGEVRFENLEQLQAQIRSDADVGRAILQSTPLDEHPFFLSSVS